MHRRLLALCAVLLACLWFGAAGASASVTFVGSSVDSGTASFFGSATATPAVPAGTQNGDLMVATVAASASGGWTTSGFSDPAGWTLLDTSTTGATLATYWRIANSEPASYSWSYMYPGGAGGASTVAEIDTYTGNTAASPITAGNSTTGSGTSVPLPNDTATVAGSMRVSLVASYKTSTTAAVTNFPAGMTRANHIEATTGQNANVGGGYATQGVGATTSYTATLTTAATRWLAGTYVINASPPTKVGFTTQPVGAVGEGVNLGTQPKVSIQLPNSATDATASGDITLSIASGPAGGVLTCTSGLTVSTVSGVASFAGCQITGTAGAGTYTIVATSPGLTSATSASFTITVGAANKVAFTTDPVGGVTEGVNLATQPVVRIQDAYGNTVTGNTSSVTLAIASGPGSGILTCTTNPRSATAGTATFAGCTITGLGAAGTYTLIATDGALASDTSNPFTINVGAATKLLFTTQPTGGVAEGVDLPTQPAVTVQDAYNNPVTGSAASVNLTVASGPPSGTLACTTRPLAASGGTASFDGCRITGTAAAGSYTLSASATGLTSATSTSFTIVTGAAAQLAFTTQPVGGVAENVNLPTQPAVTVQDAFGNAVTASTASVTLAIASGPGSGILTCTANPLAASAGVATFAACKITGTAAAGAYTLSAAAAGLSSATSSTFTIVVGAAAKVAFTTQPGGGVTLGIALSPQPVVTIQDAFGNTVTGNTSSVTLAIASGPAGGSLACTTNPRAASAGVATFAGCKINGAGATGSYTLLATDGALTSATSSSFTITAGSLSFTTSDYGFAGVTLNGLNLNPTATLTMSISDTTGSNAGWRVQASAAPWTGGSSGALTSAQVANAAPATATCNGGPGTCTPAVPTSVVWPMVLGASPVTLFNASANTGQGPQTVNVPLVLPIPASTLATGTFTQLVTLSLTSGP